MSSLSATEVTSAIFWDVCKAKIVSTIRANAVALGFCPSCNKAGLVVTYGYGKRPDRWKCANGCGAEGERT